MGEFLTNSSITWKLKRLSNYDSKSRCNLKRLIYSIILKKNAWQKTLYAKTKDNTLEENICKYILGKGLISLICKEL